MKATPEEQIWVRLVARMITRQRDRKYSRKWAVLVDRNIGFHIRNFSGGNPARFLRLVAEVLNGKKLRGAPHDDLIWEAIELVIKRRTKNRTGRGMVVRSDRGLIKEIDAAYIDLTKQGGRLTERQVRRRVEEFGLGLSPDKPGAPKKSNRTKRAG